jgi:hypothetical protein
MQSATANQEATQPSTGLSYAALRSIPESVSDSVDATINYWEMELTGLKGSVVRDDLRRQAFHYLRQRLDEREQQIFGPVDRGNQPDERDTVNPDAGLNRKSKIENRK